MSNFTGTTTRDIDVGASQASPANTVKNIAELAGRGFLAVLFLLSGLSKIGAYAATAG